MVGPWRPLDYRRPKVREPEEGEIIESGVSTDDSASISTSSGAMEAAVSQGVSKIDVESQIYQACPLRSACYIIRG